MNNVTRLLIVLALVSILIIHHKQRFAKPSINKPVPVVVIPDPTPAPEPRVIVPKDIIIDDYNHTVSCGKQLNKPVLIVFTADWCGFCNSLKKELKSIIPDHKYVVGYLDIDNEINKELLKKYRIESLPTSILLDSSGKEIKRKKGFIRQNYKAWLEE